jgi:hypothetical protein
LGATVDPLPMSLEGFRDDDWNNGERRHDVAVEAPPEPWARCIKSKLLSARELELTKCR